MTGGAREFEAMPTPVHTDGILYKNVSKTSAISGLGLYPGGEVKSIFRCWESFNLRRLLRIIFDDHPETESSSKRRDSYKGSPEKDREYCVTLTPVRRICKRWQSVFDRFLNCFGPWWCCWCWRWHFWWEQASKAGGSPLPAFPLTGKKLLNSIKGEDEWKPTPTLGHSLQTILLQWKQSQV